MHDANSFQTMHPTSINCIKHDIKVRGGGGYRHVTMTLGNLETAPNTLLCLLVTFKSQDILLHECAQAIK